MTQLLSLNVHSGPKSRTSQLWRWATEAIQAELKQKGNESVEIMSRDLLSVSPAPVTSQFLRDRFQNLPPEASELLQSDGVIWSFPIWNFSLPSVLKSYIDRAIVPGVTFRFQNDGTLVSQMKGKKAFIFCVAGGPYPHGGAKPYQSLLDLIRFLQMDLAQEIFIDGLDLPNGTSKLNEIVSEVVSPRSAEIPSAK